MDSSEIKVLVIDANAHIRRLVKTLLGAIAIDEVIEARTTGMAEGLMALGPDMVIVDWTGDGTEALLFIHRIRRGELGGARDVPILAMAATAHHAVLQSAVEAGIDDVITKPLSAFEVIHRTAALLEQARRVDWSVDAKAAE